MAAALPVAFDLGPVLRLPQSGIRFAVEALHSSLDEREDIELIDYVVGFHGHPGARRVPIPVDWALRCWSRWTHPDMRWWLRGAAVVHGTFFGVPPTGKPSVVSVHDTWFLRHADEVSDNARLAGEALRRAVRNGATVHATSAATAADAAELMPGARIEVIPLGPIGVPAAPERSPIPPVGRRPFVVAIGNLERRKNLPVLIQAFAAVAAEEPDPLLVLAGSDGGDRAAIEAAIDAAGPAVAARILRAGPIDAAARAWLLRNAAVLALPSLDEGFGLPLLDAMEVDLPIVASRAGAIIEVAGDAALLCDPGDVAAFAEHLRLALTDDVTRRRLIDNGRRRLSGFSWDETATRMTALYQQVADAGVKVCVASGGVGAARFLRALSEVVPAGDTTAVVNTGDDTVLYGLHISPDLDTVTYTLAGEIDDRGWGLAGETWEAMGALGRYEAPWFNLGDHDLATHMYRSSRLAAGATLTEVTAEITAAWGLAQRVLPMCDQRVATMITLAEGSEVSFQEYFVRRHHDVAVSAVRFEGADRAVLGAAAAAALDNDDVVVIAPSNPLVSIGPLRAVPGVEAILARRRSSVVGISPIVGGAALKGPADRMLRELGHEPTVVGVARLYAPIAASLVIDPLDAHLADAVEAEGISAVITPSVMSEPGVGRRLAEAVIAAAMG